MKLFTFYALLILIVMLIPGYLYKQKKGKNDIDRRGFAPLVSDRSYRSLYRTRRFIETNIFVD